MPRNKPQKPVSKLTAAVDKVPEAAPSPAPQPAESQKAPPTHDQDPPRNDGDSNPASHSDTTELVRRPFTRSQKEIQNQIKAARIVIDGELGKLRDLVAVSKQPSAPKTPQENLTVTSVSRDIVKDIDDFCTELIEDEQFKAAMSKLSVKPGLQDKLNIEGIVTHIQKDFKTNLRSSDDKVANIVQSGMSLTYVEAEVEAEGGDPDGDYAVELDNTIDCVNNIFEDVENLLLKQLVSRSFSTVRKKDYRRLGVSEKKLVPAIPLCSKVVDGIAFQVLLQTEFGEAWERVLEEMKVRMVATIDNFWNILSEESTRLLINEIKHCLVSANVVRVDVEDAQIICFPELSLGSLPRSRAQDSTAKQGTATVIQNQDGHLTRLTGSTDYFTFYTADARSVRSIKATRSQWNGSAARLHADIIGDWKSEAFAIVEAKSPLTHLETHLPQVVAEAIALGRKKNKKYVPFCLTSGMFWIFGVLREKDNKRTFWRTTQIPFRPTRGGILLLLSMMLSWVSVSPKELWKLGESRSKGKEDERD